MECTNLDDIAMAENDLTLSDENDDSLSPLLTTGLIHLDMVNDHQPLALLPNDQTTRSILSLVVVYCLSL